jgi:hypothetical protein
MVLGAYISWECVRFFLIWIHRITYALDCLFLDCVGGVVCSLPLSTSSTYVYIPVRTHAMGGIQHCRCSSFVSIVLVIFSYPFFCSVQRLVAGRSSWCAVLQHSPAQTMSGVCGCALQMPRVASMIAVVLFFLRFFAIRCDIVEYRCCFQGGKGRSKQED